MNNLLKYGLPSLFAVALTMPAMAQNAGSGNQMGQNGNGQSYSQNGNYGQNGSSGNNGQTYGQNGNYGGQNGNNGNNSQSYGQNGNYGNGQNGQSYGENGNYGNGQNGNNGQSYGQNGNYGGQNGSYGNNGRSYGQNGNYGNGQNGNYGQNYGRNFPPNSGNEEAVTRGFVAHVQRRLEQQGSYNGNIDGLWGPGTQAAVEHFQQQHNLRPTGQLDMQTLAALNIMQGQQFGQNGSYQTYDRGNQGQNYSSNGSGNNGSNGYGNNGGQNNR